MKSLALLDRLIRLRTGLGAGLFPYYADVITGTRRLLNLGSGDGVLSQYIRQTLEDIEVIDVDIVDANKVGRSPLLYNGRNIPLPDSSVDIVLCEFVLHHTKIHEHLINEMIRVCEKGIIITEDCVDGPIDRLLCAIHDIFTRSMNMGRKANFRSKREWINLFRHIGLSESSVVEIPRKFNIIYPVSRSIFFLIKNKSKRQFIRAAIHKE